MTGRMICSIVSKKSYRRLGSRPCDRAIKHGSFLKDSSNPLLGVFLGGKRRWARLTISFPRSKGSRISTGWMISQKAFEDLNMTGDLLSGAPHRLIRPLAIRQRLYIGKPEILSYELVSPIWFSPHGELSAAHVLRYINKS